MCRRDFPYIASILFMRVRKTVFSKLSTLKGSFVFSDCLFRIRVDVFKEKKIRMDETLFSICCLLMVSKFPRGI